MATFFKILLFFFIAYFIINWLRGLISPSPSGQKKEKDVRIFKNKEVEKSRMDVQDAETIEFEEIKNPREHQM